MSVEDLFPLANHAAILRAVAHANARDVHLTIIGDGPTRSRLEALSRKLGIADRVEFSGRVSREQTWRRLWDAHGFVSMSRRNGFPVAALEAMSCFCPLLLSNTLAHREIQGTRAGLFPLFEPDDHQGLALAIDGLASMPLDVLRAWGRDCRQHVAQRYPLERTAQRFQRMLDAFASAATPEWNVLCRSVRRHGRPRRAA